MRETVSILVPQSSSLIQSFQSSLSAQRQKAKTMKHIIFDAVDLGANH